MQADLTTGIELEPRLVIVTETRESLKRLVIEVDAAGLVVVGPVGLVAEDWGLGIKDFASDRDVR